jgi:folate-dependent phosphoribosylglycinamide formyltransferase PurN
MAKIVCLVEFSPPACLYFVNRINEKHKVSLVVVEHPSVTKRAITKIKSRGIGVTLEALRNRLVRGINKKRYTKEYKRCFGNKWQSIDKSIPILEVDNINSDTVYERLKKEQPDLIVDHGTAIVKDHILETAKLALNLHWGLSPYYRGPYCTAWALIRWDPLNIGVTIHKLTGIIDGGEILGQKRAVVQSGDTENSINMQLTQLGAEIVVTAIDKMKRGEELQFKKQDYSMGFLTTNRQWSKYLRKHIEFIEKNNLIEKMLKRPSRNLALPIVEL